MQRRSEKVYVLSNRYFLGNLLFFLSTLNFSLTNKKKREKGRNLFVERRKFVKNTKLIEKRKFDCIKKKAWKEERKFERKKRKLGRKRENL